MASKTIKAYIELRLREGGGVSLEQIWKDARAAFPHRAPSWNYVRQIARGRAPDPLAAALRCTTLDECVLTIQDALGIKTGDVAGQCFSDNDRKTYAALSVASERAYFIKSWLGAELDDAAARVEESR